MKVLLVHPDDDVQLGPWRRTTWDLIVDFGWSGHNRCLKIGEQLGCRLLHYRALLSPDEYHRRLRKILGAGLGGLIGVDGLDWWDVLVPYYYGVVEQIMLMSALAERAENGAEFAATRPHALVRTLEMVLGQKIRSFGGQREGTIASRFRRYRNAAADLRTSQLAQIAFDKWDVDYRLRRLVSADRIGSSDSMILLPSAYENVSRAQTRYAVMLPDHRFLQVVTRKSGRIADLSPNVGVRSLASYAPLPFKVSTEQECDRLLQLWNDFQRLMSARSTELANAHRMGAFAGAGQILRKLLRVRDAWLRVFETEPISAVLSADENNPLTRLPVLLARARQIPTTYCDHGALNLTPSIRWHASDTYLARGEMARDYWVRWCGLPPHRVLVGASQSASPPAESPNRKPDSIVFFSEQYELSSGRVAQFYQEVLPPLCALALKTGSKLIVKLHPFESARNRRRLVDKLLSAQQSAVVQVVDGALTPELLERAWCAITVESSIVLDCALYRVPCFLCSWLDVSWSGYASQFVQFGVGHVLNSAEEITGIPGLLGKIRRANPGALSAAIDPQRLAGILLGSDLARLSEAGSPETTIFSMNSHAGD